jgi:hypothetical protein
MALALVDRSSQVNGGKFIEDLTVAPEDEIGGGIEHSGSDRTNV